MPVSQWDTSSVASFPQFSNMHRRSTDRPKSSFPTSSVARERQETNMYETSVALGMLHADVSNVVSFAQL